jgi:hypothetical protein
MAGTFPEGPESERRIGPPGWRSSLQTDIVADSRERFADAPATRIGAGVQVVSKTDGPS